MVIKKQKANPKAGPKKNRAHNLPEPLGLVFDDENDSCTFCAASFEKVGRAGFVQTKPPLPEPFAGLLAVRLGVCKDCIASVRDERSLAALFEKVQATAHRAGYGLPQPPAAGHE